MAPVRDLDPVFVGRNQSLIDLDCNVQEGVRLITITGGPGLGKSRLANKFAANVEGFDAVWRVDVSGARTEDDVLVAVGATLGVEVACRGKEGCTALSEGLAQKGRTLVIIDGAEGALAGVASLLSVALEEASQAVFVVTSQVPLALSAELRFELEPLDREEAATLFIERARQLVRDYLPLNNEHTEIGQLVELLDRIPLAIELAASRVATMPVSELRQKLQAGLAFLRSHRRDAPARHETMESAIAWSWQLLNPAERNVLAQLSVFAGPFTTEAVEAVVVTSGPSTLELLQTLRDRSLLRRVVVEGRACMRLFDSVRAFARTQLGDAEGAILDRHADFFADRFASTTDLMYGVQGTMSIGDLVREQDDLIAAMKHALQRRPDVAARCAIVLARVISVRGPGWRGWDIIMGMAAHIERLASYPELHARLLIAKGAFARKWFGRLDSRSDLEQAVEILEQLPLRALESEARCYLGALQIDSNELEAGRAQIDIAFDMSEADGHPVAVTLCRGARARALFHSGQLAASVRAYEETLAVPLESQRFDARYRTARARARYELGDLSGAEADYLTALERQRAFDDRHYLPVTLLGLASLRLAQAQLESAVEFAVEAQQRVVHAEFERMIGAPEMLLGWTHLDAGRIDEGRRFLRRAFELAQSPRSHGYVHFALAMSDLVAGRFDEAERELSAALDTHAYHAALGYGAVFRAAMAFVRRMGGSSEVEVRLAMQMAKQEAAASESRRVHDCVCFFVEAASGHTPLAGSVQWPELRLAARAPAFGPKTARW
ncbi:MAG: AAA family ATPase, partial [Myxococcota bacterium]